MKPKWNIKGKGGIKDGKAKNIARYVTLRNAYRKHSERRCGNAYDFLQTLARSGLDEVEKVGMFGDLFVPSSLLS